MQGIHAGDPAGEYMQGPPSSVLYIETCTVAGSVVGPLSAMLLKLYVLRQPMLSRSSTDCLEMLCSARNSHLGPAALGDILQQVLQQESAWLQKDTDLMLALTKLVETGFIRLVCTQQGLILTAF